MKMFVSASLIFFLSLIAHSNDSKFTVGLSGGPNITGLIYNEEMSIWESTNHQINYSIFASFEYNFTPNISIQTGIRYSTISNEVKIDPSVYPQPIPPGFNVIDKFSIKHDVLYLPVYFKYNIPNLQYLYLLAGFETGYILSSHMKSTEYSGSENSDNIQEHISKNNTTIDAGIGFEKDIGLFKLFSQMVYSHGVTYISKEDFWAIQWKTQELYLVVGLKYLF